MVVGDFLFCLEFCKITSMLDPLISLCVATVLGFPLLFFDCSVDCEIPPPCLFSPPVFLGKRAHVSAAFSKLDFSLLQSSAPPLQAFLEILRVMKATWYSQWVYRSLSCQVLRPGRDFFSSFRLEFQSPLQPSPWGSSQWVSQPSAFLRTCIFCHDGRIITNFFDSFKTSEWTYIDTCLYSDRQTDWQTYRQICRRVSRNTSSVGHDNTFSSQKGHG